MLKYKVWYIANPPDKGVSFKCKTLKQAKLLELQLIAIVRYVETRTKIETIADVSGIMVYDNNEWIDYEE